MLSLKVLLEDAFQDQVEEVYEAELSGFYLRPEMFDRDALQLGVLYEAYYTETFAEALAKTMIMLARSPHFYDDVSDYGRRDSDLGAGNQITWTGTPSIYK